MSKGTLKAAGFVGMTHAAIGAADLTRAVKFYTEHLGFEHYYAGDSDWAMVRMGTTTISLLRQPAMAAAPIPESFHPAHLGISVESKEVVDETWDRFSRTLDVVISKPKLHRDGSYGFYFQDTEGNNLEVIYIPPIPLDLPLGKKATILMAHGSKDPNWKKPFESLLASVRGNFPAHGWELAYMECEPSLQAGFRELLKVGTWDSVGVLPIFLAAGAHTLRDIPAQIADVKKAFPQVAVNLLAPIGLDAHFQRGLLESVLLAVEKNARS